LIDILEELFRDSAKDLTVMAPAATVGSIALPFFDLAMPIIRFWNFPLEAPSIGHNASKSCLAWLTVRAFRRASCSSSSYTIGLPRGRLKVGSDCDCSFLFARVSRLFALFMSCDCCISGLPEYALRSLIGRPAPDLPGTVRLSYSKYCAPDVRRPPGRRPLSLILSESESANTSN
jgi:hypothetical protein